MICTGVAFARTHYTSDFCVTKSWSRTLGLYENRLFRVSLPCLPVYFVRPSGSFPFP